MQNSRKEPQFLRNLFVLMVCVNILVIALVLGGGGLLPWQQRQQGVLGASDEATPAPATSYGAKAEIERSLRRYRQPVAPAGVVAAEAAPGRKVSLTLDGFTDEETMYALLDIIAGYDTEVTFYLSGMQAAELPQLTAAIAAAGHRIGNYTLHGEAAMERLPGEELVADFTTSGKILRDLTGAAPARLKCNASEYTGDLLLAANASGLPEATRSSHLLTYHSFVSYDQVKGYVDRLPYESIVSVKLSGQLEEGEWEPKVVLEDPAIDKQPDTEADKEAESIRALPPSERLRLLVGWLLQAIEETPFDPRVVELRQQNGGLMATQVKGLYTTEPAVAYLFYGLGRMHELEAILEALKEQGAVGTFLVSLSEMERYPEQVALLLKYQQAVGLCYYPQQGDDYYTIASQLLAAREMLEQRGIQGARVVFQPWGEPGEALREAASALGCTLVGYDVSLAREEGRAARDPEEALAAIYGQNTYGFFRGALVALPMNFYDDGKLLGELVAGLPGTRNAYPVKDATLVCHNTDAQWTYPLPESRILPEVLDAIHPGQLRGDVAGAAAERYIGNKDILSQQLPGFTPEEGRALDKRGRLENGERRVYLTFDDWGSDVPITRLLEVLKKHGVKATFFVRTEYVPNNPNLLRAIALEGHEVASHTHTHMPLAHDPNGRWKFQEISEEEAEALQADLVASWQVLQGIVGDIRLENGEPALSTAFRPPTMAVSRAGMEAVFDCGFSYIVNGSFTTQDYKAKSAEELFRKMRNGMQEGSVVILHMSDNSVYTAEALDMLLEWNAGRPEGERFCFGRVSDGLRGDGEVLEVAVE